MGCHDEAMNGTALVVGGSSAIGAAVGSTLSGLGLDVVLWGRDPDRLEESRQLVVANGGAARAVAVDVADRRALESAVGSLAEAEPLRTVVWAAGVFDWAPVDEADADAWEHLIDVNLTAAAVATRMLMPQLLECAPSAMLYIGSGASRQAFANNAAYVASKHGLLGLSQAVWMDVRDRGVKVSLISPGLVAAGAGLQAPIAAAHPDWLLQRADVAAAVAFVAYPERGCPTEIRIETHRTL
jgi:NADP-dependent 3-hydroxy acid dehydrogenase YdfG